MTVGSRRGMAAAMPGVQIAPELAKILVDDGG